MKMVIEKMVNNTVQNLCDDTKNDARLNVLYSPFRKREVNPQDWESKMSFWKNNMLKFCTDSNSSVFTISNLQSVFVRNGRPASCFETVLDDMLQNNEIIRLQEFLNKDTAIQSWSAWAVNSLVKTPIVWSFNKLKESLITKKEISIDEEFVHLAVLKKHCELLRDCSKRSSTKCIIGLEEVQSILGGTDELSVKVALHWLQLQGQAVILTVNNKTLVKLSSGSEHVRPLSEADVGLYKLQQNEHTLKQMLEQLEKEKQETDQEARSYLNKGMRQVAKSCLRKKKELEKCIDKRSSALENVQILLSRVKEAESDAEILESYKVGLSALKATFKDAGLSENSVSHTMDQVQEVLEIHEEIQNALSEPVAASVDEDLEKELAELLSRNTQESDSGKQYHDEKTHVLDKTLPDLPEPPTHSPTPSYFKTGTRDAQRLLQ